MSYRDEFPLLDVSVDACCRLSKQDIPDVEAVIDLILPLTEGAWEATAEDLVEIALSRMAGLERPLDPEEDSAALEDLILAIVGALELRLGAVLSVEGQKAVLAAVERLLSAGGASVGAPVFLGGVGAAGLPQTGLGDLELGLRGRVQVRRAELGQLIQEAVTGSEELSGFRPSLEGILGRAVSTWLPFVVDTWAYRWFNVGTFVGGRQQGVNAFRIFNNPPLGPDGRTTPICRVAHNRLVPVAQVEIQLSELARASRNNNIRLAMNTWPLWRESDGTSNTELDAFLRRAGLPPYHGKCRSIARPA